MLVYKLDKNLSKRIEHDGEYWGEIEVSKKKPFRWLVNRKGVAGLISEEIYRTIKFHDLVDARRFVYHWIHSDLETAFEKVEGKFDEID